MMNALLMRCKIAGQFFKYILFAKSDFPAPLLLRLRMAFGGGFTVNEYYIFDLQHCDKNEYLSELDWFRSRMINAGKAAVLNNKEAFQRVIENIAPCPQMLLVCSGGDVFDYRTKESLNNQKILSVLQKEADCIIKPRSKGKGRGITRIRFTEGKFRLDDKACSPDEMLSCIRQSSNSVVCAYVKQHPYAEKIYPASVNTIRFLVARDGNNRMELLYAVQRFGRKGTGPADNASRGGYLARIDLPSGELSELRSIRELFASDVHPDTGVRVKGTVVPGWEMIRSEVLRISEHFEELRFIAWDIAVTPEGYSIIEGNASTGVNIIQLWGGQRHAPFGDFLRREGAIR